MFKNECKVMFKKLKTDWVDKEALNDLLYPLEQELKVVKHLQKRCVLTQVEVLDELRKRVGFFKLFNLFEKYTTLTIEFKILQQKCERQEKKFEERLMQLEKKFKGEDDLLGVPLPALKEDKSPSHIYKNEKKQPVR